MNIALRCAKQCDLPLLLDYVRAFHAHMRISLPPHQARAALEPLLEEHGPGRIWLIELDAQPIGYLAVCFGYSIEFGGRDGFIDEFYITPEQRGQGHASAALSALKPELEALQIHALHLEAAHDDAATQKLYRTAGFIPREKYFLMSARLK